MFNKLKCWVGGKWGRKGLPFLLPTQKNSWIWTISEANDRGDMALLVCWFRKISCDTWPRCLRKDRKKGRPHTIHTVALAVSWVNKWILYQLGVESPHYFTDMVLFFIADQRWIAFIILDLQVRRLKWEKLSHLANVTKLINMSSAWLCLPSITIEES